MTVMGSSTKTLLLRNEGQQSFKFHWESSSKRVVSVEPDCGQVDPGKDQLMIVECHPLSPGDLKTEKIKCTISNGPVFGFNLKGVVKQPRIEITPQEIDFGSVFVRQVGMKELESMPMKLKNKTKEIQQIQFHLDTKTDLKVNLLLFF